MKLAIAAWKNAVCVRSSQPLAASCGNSRIGSEPPVLPPATITSAMHRTSPISSAETSVGRLNGSVSRWTIQNVASPKMK